MAYPALFFALGDTAIAAKPLVTGADVQDGSLTGAGTRTDMFGPLSLTFSCAPGGMQISADYTPRDIDPSQWAFAAHTDDGAGGDVQGGPAQLGPQTLMSSPDLRPHYVTGFVKVDAPFNPGLNFDLNIFGVAGTGGVSRCIVGGRVFKQFVNPGA